MQRIIFTNARGQSVELKSSAPFLLQSIEGLGDVDADIQTQKAPFQDGSTYIDSVLQERAISLEIVILAADKPTLLQQRQFFASVFNPKLGKGILRYENGTTVREIEAVPDGVPTFPSGKDNHGPIFQKAIVHLVCPEPFWLDEFSTSEKMSYILGGLSFPLRLGTMFAHRGFKKVLYNQGDVATPVTIEFYGPATNPVVWNRTTNEFIKVNRTLVETDKLVITTDFGNKSVTIENEDGTTTNVFNWIDLESTFWQLVQGDNIVEYGSDSDATKSRVIVSYKNRYLSV
ncbi:phage tail family protein [Anoxybacillus flavithermus]|uniref:Phage-related putative tail protein n=1 Tax=Anoxybacillus flavithermus (strain DSM 21510 / WK1) TaxID=491915 RepID=B7GIN9_ANOFW|nr:phage tail family protein [Anoxybacillus flavithermus]ACJ33054.1 Phage-related putative tail protein [Anoxybacillus flavithermus WK1]